MLKVTGKDVRGVISMPPTPTTPNGGSWRAIDSIDYDTSKKLISMMVGAGVKNFALCGTTGECACLLWEEKAAFIKTAVEENKKRSVIFAGCTALGTKEVIRQMRAMKDIGAEGAFIGLPLWQTPTLENSVQFYADLGEALPDFPILIYSNYTFFKSDFLPEFWAGISKKAPTVACDKISHGTAHIQQDLDAAPNINFIPNTGGAYNLWKKVGARVTTTWATSPAPEPYVALIDAMNRNDATKAEQIQGEIRAAMSSGAPRPAGAAQPENTNWKERQETDHARYNAQHNKHMWNASGYINMGPFRAPYIDLPEHEAHEIEESMKKWMPFRDRFVKAAAAK